MAAGGGRRGVIPDMSIVFVRSFTFPCCDGGLGDSDLGLPSVLLAGRDADI